MKIRGYSSLHFLVLGAAFICLVCSSKGTSFFTHDAAALTMLGNDMTVNTINRKLKDTSNVQSANDHQGSSKAYIDDYGPIDPVPSSKASIRPGPIQHGTPLMPYIPNPSPPPGSSAAVGLP